MGRHAPDTQVDADYVSAAERYAYLLDAEPVTAPTPTVTAPAPVDESLLPDVIEDVAAAPVLADGFADEEVYPDVYDALGVPEDGSAPTLTRRQLRTTEAELDKIVKKRRIAVGAAAVVSTVAAVMGAVGG